MTGLTTHRFKKLFSLCRVSALVFCSVFIVLLGLAEQISRNFQRVIVAQAKIRHPGFRQVFPRVFHPAIQPARIDFGSQFEQARSDLGKVGEPFSQMTAVTSQLDEYLFPLGQDRRALEVQNIGVTIHAVGLHERTAQDGLVDSQGLVHFMMRSVRIFSRRRGGSLPFVTPGTTGHRGIVLSDQHIPVRVGFDRFGKIFVVGIVVGDMAALTAIDLISDLGEIVAPGSGDDRLENFGRPPDQIEGFVIIHLPFDDHPVIDQLGQFLLKVFLFSLEVQKGCVRLVPQPGLFSNNGFPFRDLLFRFLNLAEFNFKIVSLVLGLFIVIKIFVQPAFLKLLPFDSVVVRILRLESRIGQFLVFRRLFKLFFFSFDLTRQINFLTRNLFANFFIFFHSPGILLLEEYFLKILVSPASVLVIPKRPQGNEQHCAGAQEKEKAIRSVLVKFAFLVRRRGLFFGYFLRCGHEFQKVRY